jgi:hypothetical protein
LIVVSISKRVCLFLSVVPMIVQMMSDHGVHVILSLRMFAD